MNSVNALVWTALATLNYHVTDRETLQGRRKNDRGRHQPNVGLSCTIIIEPYGLRHPLVSSWFPSTMSLLRTTTGQQESRESTRDNH